MLEVSDRGDEYAERARYLVRELHVPRLHLLLVERVLADEVVRDYQQKDEQDQTHVDEDDLANALRRLRVLEEKLVEKLVLLAVIFVKLGVPE